MDWRPKSPGPRMDLGINRPKIGSGARATSTNHHNPSRRVTQPPREVPRIGCNPGAPRNSANRRPTGDAAGVRRTRKGTQPLAHNFRSLSTGWLRLHPTTQTHTQTSRPGKQWRFCSLVCFRIRDETDGFGTCFATAPMGFGGGLLPRPRFASRFGPTCTTSVGSLAHHRGRLHSMLLPLPARSWQLRPHRERQTATATRDAAPRI